MTLAGAGMLASAVVEKLSGGSDSEIFLASGLLIGLPGLTLWNRTRPPSRIPAATIFAAALAGWTAFCLAATIPYLASGTLVRFDLALFEAIAGATTTASTVLGRVGSVSEGLLFWRAITQWIGGISIVVVGVSVLPFLGVGGMELFQTGTPGPATERLGSRVRSTAERLVPVYMGFTVVVAAAYAAFGMRATDAVTYSFTTVSTGGFTNPNLSGGYFGRGALDWVAIAAMVLAGSSLTLYWRSLRGKPLTLFRSAEFRSYLAIVAGFAGVVATANAVRFGFNEDVVRRSIFSMVSLSTTTGFNTTIDHDAWVPPLQLMAVFAMGLGGMSASSAGGFKIFRFMAVLSHTRRQAFRQLHPRAVSVVRFGGQIVPEAAMSRVVGFFGLFMATGAVATVLLATFGADMRTAIAAAASTLGNVGPALGTLRSTFDYAVLHTGSRVVLMVTMLLGRLEIFPVLLGLVPLVRFIGDRLPWRVSQVLLRWGRG
jgi:trk system potassium uptake protein TrkH